MVLPDLLNCRAAVPRRWAAAAVDNLTDEVIGATCTTNLSHCGVGATAASTAADGDTAAGATAAGAMGNFKTKSKY